MIYAEKELNKANAMLPAMRCMSNEDMDPKNIMWEDGSPWVIDLECLDYGNPGSHALILDLQQARTVTYALDTEKLVAFFEGCLKAYDNGFRGYSELFGVAYNWVNWLEYTLPAGYRFVPYSDADSFDILPDRMFFVETDKGEKVATATAVYNIYGKDTSGAGWLYWVAIKREHQGKGLSKPLITYVLKQMKKISYTHAKIPIQTNTWLACKIYLDLGFIPIKKNLEHSYEGWKMLKALTNHSGLADL